MATTKDPQTTLPNDDGAFDTTLVTDRGVPVVASVLKFAKPKDKPIFPEDAKPQYRLGERVVFLCEGRVTKAGLEADPDWTTDEDKPGDMTRVQEVKVTRMRVLSPREAVDAMGKLGMKPGKAARDAKAAEVKAAKAKEGDELARKRAAKEAEAKGETPPPAETSDEPKPLAKMSKAELVEVAELEGVDLSGAKNNKDRVAFIELKRAEGGGEPEGASSPTEPTAPLPDVPTPAPAEEPTDNPPVPDDAPPAEQEPSPPIEPVDFAPVEASEPAADEQGGDNPAGTPVVPAGERIVFTEAQLQAKSMDQLRTILSHHGVPGAGGDQDTLVSMILTMQEPD